MPKLTLTILTSLFTFTILSSDVHADVDIGSIFGQGTIVAGSISTITTFAQLLNPIIFTFYSIAGVVILFVLIYGGYMYIMGAGQADKKHIKQGQDALIWGFAGLILVIASFWLIQVIEIITGLQILTGGGL